MISIQNPADLTAPSKEFTFDSAYDSKSSTENIYNDICYPLVEVRANLQFNWIFYQNSAYFNDARTFLYYVLKGVELFV